MEIVGRGRTVLKKNGREAGKLHDTGSPRWRHARGPSWQHGEDPVAATRSSVAGGAELGGGCVELTRKFGSLYFKMKRAHRT